MRNVAELADLRERIAALERRPMLAEGARLLGGRQGLSPFATPPGLLHEVFADEQRDGGAAFGFALGLMHALVTESRPALLFLQLLHQGQDVGLPYGPGLEGFGVPAGRTLIGRVDSMAELLWAAEEAIACRAVAAVVVEVLGMPKALDFTVSRRLSLRAASGGTSILLIRYGREREASAARLRWHVGPARSQPPPFDARAPGRGRWQVELEKGQLEPGRNAAGTAWVLDWTDDGFVPVSAGEDGSAARAALPGAASAALGDRLSQAG